MDKPISVKIITAFSIFYLTFIVLFLGVILTISIQGPENTSEFMRGFYEGATKISSSLEPEQIGRFIGSSILPIVGCIIVLLSVYGRSDRLRNIGLAIFVILFLSSLGNKSFSLPSTVFIIFLLLKSVKDYISFDAKPKITTQ